MNDILLLIALFGTVVFLIMNTYYYFVLHWEAEARLYADNLRLATQKAVITPVLVDLIEDNYVQDPENVDPPTVVQRRK
jgi:hypothetical protein